MNKPLAFNQEHLQLLAQILVEKRADVIDRHDPEELGDTNQSLGTRAYECTRTSIIKFSKTFEWLNTITQNGRFTFSIDGIPIRFWRGDYQKVPQKKLIRSRELEHQMKLFPENEKISQDFHWYLVIETDFVTKQANKVFLVQYDDHGNILSCNEITLKNNVTLMTDTNETLSQGIELESATSRIKIKSKPKTEESNE